MADPLSRLTAALSDRYRIEREVGQGGTARELAAESRGSTPSLERPWRSIGTDTSE